MNYDQGALEGVSGTRTIGVNNINYTPAARAGNIWSFNNTINVQNQAGNELDITSNATLTGSYLDFKGTLAATNGLKYYEPEAPTAATCRLTRSPA